MNECKKVVLIEVEDKCYVGVKIRKGAKRCQKSASDYVSAGDVKPSKSERMKPVIISEMGNFLLYANVET